MRTRIGCLAVLASVMGMAAEAVAMRENYEGVPGKRGLSPIVLSPIVPSMRTLHGMLKRITKLGLLLMIGASMCAEAGFLGFGADSWKEEVLLHDGNKIIVTRTVERGGRHEIGQQPPIKEQSLSFTLPGTNEKVTWEDKFTEDVGGANFLPMQLQARKDTAYLVAYPMGCLSYNKWGRPNPPYVVFKYQGKAWQRITLQELPAEFKMPNLIFSSPDDEAKKAGQRIVPAETIKALYEGYRQPEYKTILREALPKEQINQMCMEMVLYKGKWIMPNDPVMRAIIDRKSE